MHHTSRETYLTLKNRALTHRKFPELSLQSTSASHLAMPTSGRIDLPTLVKVEVAALKESLIPSFSHVHANRSYSVLPK